MMNTDFAQQSRDYQRVEEAIHYLESNFRQHPSLDEMADRVHLSKYHFQRLFKRWAGISPTQFMQFLTLEYAKRRLQESQSVLDTALDAGLSGPSRLHDLFVTFEAMTPGEYKRRGVGLEISYGFHDTPFGECLLATTDRGICGLHFVQARHFVQAEHLAEGNARSAALETLTRDWPRATFVEEPRQTQPFVDRIFAPDVIQQSRPFHLLLKGTNFQVKVWQALLAIPPGSMVSYQDLATYIGLPSAARAVGRALAKQPIAYLIPCHRVISKAGKAHQYRWGSTRKRAILGWEASHRTRTE